MSNDPFFEDVERAVRARDKGSCKARGCGKKWSNRKNAIGVSPAQTQTSVVRVVAYLPDTEANCILECRSHTKRGDIR